MHQFINVHLPVSDGFCWGAQSMVEGNPCKNNICIGIHKIIAVQLFGIRPWQSIAQTPFTTSPEISDAPPAAPFFVNA